MTTASLPQLPSKVRSNPDMKSFTFGFAKAKNVSWRRLKRAHQSTMSAVGTAGLKSNLERRIAAAALLSPV